MGKIDITKFVGNVKDTISKHSPEILVSMGIAGMVTTTVLAVKSTPKALKLIDEKKEELKTDELSSVDTIKATWKCYIPAAISFATSAACIIGANSVNTKRNAALATAYKLSETALAEYKDKVIETIGEKKEKTIREKIDKDHIDKNPVSKNNVIITEKGNTLCYDHHSGRYFRSDIDTIKKAAIEINRTMIYDMYASLNDFYDELGLAHTKAGDRLGWNLDDGKVEIEFSSQIADDGTPCIVIDYNIAPKDNFYKFI